MTFPFYILFNYPFLNSANPSGYGITGKLVTLPVLRETWRDGDTGDTACSAGKALESEGTVDRGCQNRDSRDYRCAHSACAGGEKRLRRRPERRDCPVGLFPLLTFGLHVGDGAKDKLEPVISSLRQPQRKLSAFVDVLLLDIL